MTGTTWTGQESPVVIRLSPKEECIFFENLCIEEPVYVQFLLNSHEKKMVIHPCSKDEPNACLLKPIMKVHQNAIEKSGLFIGVLYGVMGHTIPEDCRLRSEPYPLPGFDGLLFDLGKAEFLHGMKRDMGNDSTPAPAQRGEDK